MQEIIFCVTLSFFDENITKFKRSLVYAKQSIFKEKWSN